MDTLYIAFLGTKYQKCFKDKEDCLNYQKKVLTDHIEAWDENGNRVFDIECAFFIWIPDAYKEIFFSAYGDMFSDNCSGLYYWDRIDGKYHYFDQRTIETYIKFYIEHFSSFID